MNEVTLPPSPNWYLSNILDCAKDGTVAWGARNVIVIAKHSQNSKLLKYSIIDNAHTDKITSVCFSPEYGQPSKNLLVSTSDEHIVRIWDLDTLSAIRSYTYQDAKQSVVAADWSRKDANLICCVTVDGGLVSWNLSFDNATPIALGKLTATCLSCCPHDRNLVAVGSKSGLVYIVNLHGKGSVVYKLRGHDAEIVSLQWCPVDTNILLKSDAKDMLLASGAKDRSVFIWKAGGDGRYQTQLTIPANLLDTQQRRGKLNSAIGNWTALCWPEPTLLFASSTWGELISCDLSVSISKHAFKLVHSCHTRGLCCIRTLPDDVQATENWRSKKRNTIWTLAQDRHVVCCDVEENNVEIKYNIPTQGGYVYCIAACPVETSRIAFGAGDAMLRLWNLSEPHETSFDITILWQKVKGTVRAVAWHPEKENLLAYATGEGRIGVFDTNGNKPPTLYRQYHRNTVYSLHWGPSPNSKQYALYSCSEGELVYYESDKPNAAPASVIKKECTEFSWKSDFSCLAVGFENGLIVFYDKNLVERDRSSYSLKRAVYCLAWHPESTTTDLKLSPLRNYLAVATDSVTITIYDTTELLNSLYEIDGSATESINDKSKESHGKLKTVATLNGHVDNTICLAWSPHFSGYLVSGSYDHTAQVWNVETQELMGTYMGHCGSVLCCLWSPFDADLIITGSADFTVRVWKLSEQKPVVPVKKQRVKKSKKKKNKNQQDQANNITQPSSTKDVTSVLLETATEINIAVDVLKKKSDKGASTPTHTKRSNKKFLILEAIRNSIKQMNIKEGIASEEKETCLLDAELNHSKSEEKYTDIDQYLLCDNIDISTFTTNKKAEYAMRRNRDMLTEINVWTNNFKESLEEAVREKQLNDFLVSLAPSLSMNTWKETCEAYANQLVLEGNHRKAVFYLLSIHKIMEAIQVFLNAKLFKEAYLLARCKLAPEETIFQTILQEWASHTALSGEYEQAALCYTKLGDLSQAAKLLARRDNVECLECAAELAALTEDGEFSKSLAEEAVRIALTKSGCAIARTLTQKFPHIKYCEPHITAFEEIKKIIDDKETNSVEMWLKEGRSTSGLLQTIKNIHEKCDDYYMNLYQMDFSTVPKDKPSLWLTVSHQIAMAAMCDTEETQLRHVVSALSTISQFEIVHRKLVENKGSFLIHILSNLDAENPMNEGSIYKNYKYPVAKSLRAYLCFGVMSWLVDRKASTEETDVKPAFELIKSIFEDVLDEETIQFYSATSKINKLESLIASALGKTQDTDANEDTKDTLCKELDDVKNVKKKFIEERMCAPNPILVNSKIAELQCMYDNELVTDNITELWSKSIV